MKWISTVVRFSCVFQQLLCMSTACTRYICDLCTYMFCDFKMSLRILLYICWYWSNYFINLSCDCWHASSDSYRWELNCAAKLARPLNLVRPLNNCGPYTPGARFGNVPRISEKSTNLLFGKVFWNFQHISSAGL
jgi:hypothetical protein